MEFKEVFGFVPAEAGKLQSAVHQFVVDTEISHLARELETARHNPVDLNRRFLASGKAGDAAVLTEVLAAITRYQAAIAEATAAFDEAVKLAQAAGFAVYGKVVNHEAKRVFGLETISQPPNGAEVSRINKVLEALAVAFEESQRGLTDANRAAKDNPSPANLNLVGGWEVCVAKQKENFWTAHGLAEKLGAGVQESYQEYIPWDCKQGAYNWRENSKYLIGVARRNGLIR